MGLGIASPSHAHGGGRHGRRHSKEATTAMRARQLFIVLLALLSPRWQCQCFHLSWSLGQRDADRRFRSTTLVMGGSPRHQQRCTSASDEQPAPPSPPPSTRTSRRELCSTALQLGAAGGGVILARPSRVVAAEASLVTPLRDASGNTRAEGRGPPPSYGGSGLVLPAVGARTKRIFLARHGQTDLNKLEVCQGRRLNPPLNEKGRSQARTLLTGTTLGAIICSPLRRARETAGIVQQSHPLTARCSVSADLNEVDFGGAEGLPRLLAAAVLAPAYFAWSNGRLGTRAGRSGESGVALRRRAEAVAGALLGACEEGEQVLGVSHSSMIKFTLATLLDVPLGTIRKLGQDNCAVNALDFNTVSGVFKAVAINGHPARGRAEHFGHVEVEQGIANN